VVLAGILLPFALACASQQTPDPADPHRYRLSGSGTHWDVVGEDRVLDDLMPRYPEFFALILDPSHTEEPDLLVLRDDLERQPVDRRNYDALNSIAIGYFELNYRGETLRGERGFLSAGFHTAKLVAVPWRAYGDIEDPDLRDAILDFFEDVASGEKLGSSATRGRITAIVASLEPKETDEKRRIRIRRVVRQLSEATPSAEASPF
jgi:hypothetical protein